MTCPCCERNARLETSDEYDARTGDSLSGDAAIASRDIMIERCREATHGNRASENRDGSRHLRVVSDGRVGSERLEALSDIDHIGDMAGKAAGFALKLLRLSRAIEHGWRVDAGEVSALRAEAEAYLDGATSMFKAPAPIHFKQAAE